MTVATVTNVKSYSGNGSTTDFAIDFTYLAKADIKAKLINADGTVTTWALTTNFTLTDPGASGTLTAVVAPASGTTLIIYREMTITQGTDYINGDNFDADTHETAYDRLTLIIQDVKNQGFGIRPSVLVTDSPNLEFDEAAADRASKVVSFDSSGDVIVTQEIGTYQGTDATVTTAAYQERDLVKSTTAGQLNNIYICTAASAIGDSLTDTDHFALVVDAVSAASAQTAAEAAQTAAETAQTAAETAQTAAETAQTAAETAQTGAETAETNAGTSETNAATSETNAAASAAAAQAAHVLYTFSTTTTMADPGAGILRLNHATIASATAIAVDDTTANTGNPDISSFINSFDDSTNTNKGTLILREVGSPQNFAIFTVTGLTDNTGWTQLAVTHVVSNGSFADTDSLSVLFTRSGDKGADGTGSGDLLAANNLSDLANAGTARTNLGVAIGSDVQAYEAGLAYLAGLTFTNEATFKAGVNLEPGTDIQAYEAGLAFLAGLAFTNEATFKSGVNLEIGVDVAAYNANAMFKNVAQVMTAQITFQETAVTEYNLTGTVVNPANGDVQYKTLASNTTFTESLENGQAVLLMIDDGTAYTLTHPTITWLTDSGSAPTLATTGYTGILYMQMAGTLYGMRVTDGG